MQTAAAYIRVSTEDQTEYSPDSQLKKIQEYAGAHDLILPEELVFLDEGISGRSADKRPSFLKMIGLAKQKPRPFDLILVWKFSRFARSRQDSILYKSMLRRDCGIQVVSITEHLSDDPTSILIEALLEAMDEYYSINLAQEVRRGMNEKFSRGGVVSIPPFGYRMGSKHFEPDPDKASVVPMIFRDFLNGMSYRQIASRLNEMGIFTSRGNRFEGRSIEYILSNPAYLGKLRRSAEHTSSLPNTHVRRTKAAASMRIVDGHHPPLVEPETFHAVQRRIHEMKSSHPVRSRTAPARYMLHGLVRCSYCGGTLTTAEKGRSLQCCRYAKGLCSQSHHIRLNLLNQAVLSALETDLNRQLSGQKTVPTQQLPASLADPDESEAGSGHHAFRQKVTIRPSFGPTDHNPQNVVLSKRLEQQRQRLDRIQAAYESGIDSLEEYRTRKTVCIKQLKYLQSKIQNRTAADARIPRYIRFTLSDIPMLLRGEYMAEGAKNELLKSFVSHITFCRSDNTIRIHYKNEHRDAVKCSCLDTQQRCVNRSGQKGRMPEPP